MSISIHRKKSGAHTATHARWMQLPNEVVLHILAFLPTPDLLSSVCLVNSLLRSLALQVFVKKLRDPDQCRLRLFFDQESRWRASVDLRLVERQHDTQTLTFAPLDNALFIRMYTSMVLQRPTLHKIVLVGTSCLDTDAADLPDNLLPQKSLALDIKSLGTHVKTGMFPCKTPFWLSYRVVSTPVGVRKSRPGERWVQPYTFECSPLLFCQRKRGLARILKHLPTLPVLRNVSVRLPTKTLPSPAPTDIKEIPKKRIPTHPPVHHHEFLTLALN